MLTSSSRRALKARAHALKPVVIIGQKGVTDSVLASISEALDTHELIKVRLPVFEERSEKSARIAEIAAALGAEAVGNVGHVLILYRKKPE